MGWTLDPPVPLRRSHTVPPEGRLSFRDRRGSGGQADAGGSMVGQTACVGTVDRRGATPPGGAHVLGVIARQIA
jgi:hypothetical protein